MKRSTSSEVKALFYEYLEKAKDEPIQILRYKTPVGYLVYKLPNLEEKEFTRERNAEKKY